MIERINSDLANILGNLVNRTISMANKYFEGTVTNKKVTEEVDEELINQINDLDKNVESKMDKLEIGASLDVIFDLFRSSNKYIDETTPWSLAKEEDKKDRLETVLFNLLESIRVAAIYLKPYLPETSDNIFTQLNTTNDTTTYDENNSYNVGTPVPLFQRIDKEKKLAEIENN